jgi:hypothetical protein
MRTFRQSTIRRQSGLTCDDAISTPHQYLSPAKRGYSDLGWASGELVYYVAVGRDTFYMMAAYPKSERDGLPAEQRRRILAALESIKKPRS